MCILRWFEKSERLIREGRLFQAVIAGKEEELGAEGPYWRVPLEFVADVDSRVVV